MMAVCMLSTDNLASVLRLLFRWMLQYFQHQAVHLQCTALQCLIVGTSVIVVTGYAYMIICALTFFSFFLIMIFFSSRSGMRCIYCCFQIFSVLLLASISQTSFCKIFTVLRRGKKPLKMQCYLAF